MRKEAVDGAIKIAAIRLHGACDISDDGGRNIEAGVDQFRSGDARFENLDPESLVETSDFDAQTASQTRPHAFVKAFEITRRPVGRDHDLPAGIDEGIKRVTELLLNRLALEKLNIVDHKEIDCPQPFLESDRRLRFEGRDEAIHEPLSREIDDLALCGRSSMSDSLQKMSFA